jgi:hypothetical protein
MNKFWVSWWANDSGIDKDNPGPDVPFQYFVSGYRGDDGDYSCCAAFEAHSETDIWNTISQFFPEYEERFCSERDSNWNPGAPVEGGSRFPNATIYKIETQIGEDTK